MEIDNMTDKKYVKPFASVGIKDVALVGGKTASLGEMYTNLTKKGKTPHFCCENLPWSFI